jgi:hypothetical protein
VTCDRCGRPTSRRRHCADCARERRQEERAQLEDAGLLSFETIKRCRDCGATSDQVDGDYVDKQPGLWLCEACQEPQLISDGGHEIVDDGDRDSSDWTPWAIAGLGVLSLGIGVAPLVPTIWRHLQDSSVAVFSQGTIVTYLSEIWLETDFIGPLQTFFAILGLICLLAALGMMLVSLYGGDPVAE